MEQGYIEPKIKFIVFDKEDMVVNLSSSTSTTVMPITTPEHGGDIEY